MPFPLLPTVLAAFFVVIWAFIGGMILRDGQIEARRRRQLEQPMLKSRRAPRRRATRAVTPHALRDRKGDAISAS